MIDEGIVLYFAAPNSYTGEDVCELQCHGGPVIVDTLLSELVRLGARLAEPGEYTRRAFLNGKLDLVQAEAVADLINSSTAKAARSAVRSLQGEFSQYVEKIVRQLNWLRVYVEASIDFSEEDIDFLDDEQLNVMINDVRVELKQLLADTSIGCVLREGVSVAIVGLPNAGKSSLLNRLIGQDRVIVTPTAGTTRDTVDATMDVNGLAVRLTDTAGLRESSDSIETQGIDRAWKVASEADVILYVVDSARGICSDDSVNLERLDLSKAAVVWNKKDLSTQLDCCEIDGVDLQIRASALRGDGMDLILQAIEKIAGYDPSHESVFLARRRHVTAIENAARFVNNAAGVLRDQKAGELAAQDLQDAVGEMGKITKILTSDELLGEIFANFCVGK